MNTELIKLRNKNIELLAERKQLLDQKFNIELKVQQLNCEIRNVLHKIGLEIDIEVLELNAD